MLLHEFVAANGGLATLAQLRTQLSRKSLTDCLRTGALVRVCHGVYAVDTPDVLGRLRALEMMIGKSIVVCMSTAAGLYGFDTENDERLHVLDPAVRLRPTPNLVVHQRVGAPLRKLHNRPLTAPAWTAVEVARTLRRPRVLATLDAALRSEQCTLADLHAAVAEQKGRRGIVNVRELLALADPRAESPIESEARLVFHDGGLPAPDLQYEVVTQVTPNGQRVGGIYDCSAGEVTHGCPTNQRGHQFVVAFVGCSCPSVASCAPIPCESAA